MAIDGHDDITERFALRLPQHLMRRVQKLQKKLHHSSTSRTFRHLVEKGIETYEPKKAGKGKKR